MGSPLAISYATPNPSTPNPNLRKHEKRAYIPRWRGEEVAAAGKSLGPVVLRIGQDSVMQAIVKPQLGPARAFTKGSTMQMMGEQEWLTWLTWLYQCHVCDG